MNSYDEIYPWLAGLLQIINGKKIIFEITRSHYLETKYLGLFSVSSMWQIIHAWMNENVSFEGKAIAVSIFACIEEMERHKNNLE